MSKYIETLKVMHSLLRGETTPEQVADILQADPQRLAIYQGFVKGHIVKTLAKNYALLANFLPRSEWQKLANAYFASYPAKDWRLNASTECFPDFLESLLDSSDYPWLDEFFVELARFEWEEVDVFCHPEVVPAPEEVSEITLNPTVSILSFHYPIARFVRACRRKDDKEWLAAKGYLQKQANEQILFLFRHPHTRKCCFVLGDDNALFVFKIAHEQMSVTQAVEASGQAQQIIISLLQNFFQQGLVILPANLIASAGESIAT